MSILSPIPADPGVPIRRQSAYIDSLAIRFPRFLLPDELKTLKALCGEVLWEVNPLNFDIGGRWTRYPIVVTMHQPSRAALQFLVELDKGSAPLRIVLLHLALDLCTDSFADAHALHSYFRMRHYKGWHRAKHLIEVIGRTDYYGYHNWRSKLVCYSDKLSKLTNLPCYHMEWRLQSHAAIKAEGVFGVDDLMYFEHRKFWAKKLRLCELDYIKFGKRLLHQNFNTPSRYRTDYRGRRINLNEFHARSEIRIIDYDRPDWSELPPVTLMEILVAVKDKVRNVKDFLIPLGAAHLLPVCPRRPTVR